MLLNQINGQLFSAIAAPFNKTFNSDKRKKSAFQLSWRYERPFLVQNGHFNDANCQSLFNSRMRQIKF